MEREEYIKAVKSKLEEVSTFDEPDTFAVDEQLNIKPIITYIDDNLEYATKYCLNTLPLSLLGNDIEKKEYNVKVDEKGVGYFKCWNGLGDKKDLRKCRLIKIRHEEYFYRDIPIEVFDSITYKLETNYYTRGGYNKPHAYYIPEDNKIEIYSFFENRDEIIEKPCVVYFIDSMKNAEEVMSNIEEFIVLKCAEYVLKILGNGNAQIFEKEFLEKSNIYG